MLKRYVARGAAAAVAAGLIALAGVALQPAAPVVADEGGSSSHLSGLADWQTDDTLAPEEFREAVYGGYAQRAEDNPARVIEYEDGTRVQRTPTPARDSTANVRGYISWNTYRLDADNRGCQACHDDMGALVQNIGYTGHPPIDNLGTELTVQQCQDCHVTHLGGRYMSQFSGLIHGIHRNNDTFDALGGDCWSCHYGTTDDDNRGMQLWDEVKHEVLRGIETVSADKLTGTFAYDQDYVQGADEPLWTYNYVKPDDVAMERWGRDYLGMTPDPATDGVYDEWMITIGGACENPVTMSLAELIETCGSETRIMQVQCANNGEGGTYITNREVTGVPLSAIAELVGVSDDVLRLDAASADGRTAEVDYPWCEQYGAYLVYEVSGEPISYAAGYPVQLWIGGWVADEFNKNIVDLEFSTEEYEAPVFYQGAYSRENGQRVGQPTTGICYLREGQIIPVGEEFTFQGYASSIGHAIEQIEVSFDHGATWQTFDTPNNDLTKWTWWTYSWTPEKAGCYCIMVRAVDDAGCVTAEPHEIMVNVQDLSESEAE